MRYMEFPAIFALEITDRAAQNRAYWPKKWERPLARLNSNQNTKFSEISEIIEIWDILIACNLG